MDVRNSWLCKRAIAHRGLHNAEMPENSLAAFDNAAKCGYPIELDVRIIDDGTVIVFHDDKLGRMTGSDGYSSGLKVSDLKDTRLGGTEERIPTFEETLECVAGRVPLLIELKNTGNSGELESKTLQALKNYKGEFAVQSFNPYSMEYFKITAPDVMRGQLSCFFSKDELTSLKRFILKRLRMNKVSCPHFVSYCGANLPNRWVTRCKLPTLAWTIRSNAELEEIAPFCDNIIFESFIPCDFPKAENGRG